MSRAGWAVATAVRVGDVGFERTHEAQWVRPSRRAYPPESSPAQFAQRKQSRWCVDPSFALTNLPERLLRHVAHVAAEADPAAAGAHPG